MAWHNLTEKTKERKETKKDYLARIKYEKIILEKVNHFTEIVGKDLDKNVQYRFVTAKSFNAISVIEWIRQNYKLEEVFIAIYRMNQKSVTKIIEIINNSNTSMVIVLSSFFRENKKYEKWCRMLIDFTKNNNNIKVLFAWNHAKVFIAKTTCGKHIVFEGSGNLSDNARVEQYLIENNEISFNFHKKWINEITAI